MKNTLLLNNYIKLFNKIFIKTTDITKVIILIEENTWKLCRELFKFNETDISKEVRKFIKILLQNITTRLKVLL